jgi:hypothetical protein
MRQIRTILSSEAEEAFKELTFKAKNSKIEASLLKSIQNTINKNKSTLWKSGRKKKNSATI